MNVIHSLMSKWYMNVPLFFFSFISFGIYLFLNYYLFNSYKTQLYYCSHRLIILVSPLRHIYQSSRVVTTSYSWHPLKEFSIVLRNIASSKIYIYIYQTKIQETKPKEQSCQFTDTPKQTDNPLWLLLKQALCTLSLPCICTEEATSQHL